MLGIHPKSILQPHQLGAALHAHQHRRHPSAPTLSVQPTNVPGLFSLGPARAAHQAKTVREPRQPKHQSKLSTSLPASAAVTAGVPSATTKPTTPAKSEQQPSSTAATVSTSVSAITPPTTPPPAVHSQDSPKQRGRKPVLQSASKKRSPSPQARRNKDHQPDPTARPSTPPPTPKEQQQQPPASPTRKRPTHQRNNTAPSSPIVATTPAAVTKSAKRRNRRSGAPSPAQQAADKSDDEAGVPIATPVRKDQARNLSRSVPLESKMPTRAAVAEWDTPAFALASLVSGPRTAPLDKAPRFPFGEGYSPPPSPTPAARHQSVGIFDMDDDLDIVGPASKSLGSSPSVHAARRLNMAGGIFGLSGGVALSASVSTPALLSKSEADRVKFASSSFQFGPSVRALPAPAL